MGKFKRNQKHNAHTGPLETPHSTGSQSIFRFSTVRREFNRIDPNGCGYAVRFAVRSNNPDDVREAVADVERHIFGMTFPAQPLSQKEFERLLFKLSRSEIRASGEIRSSLAPHEYALTDTTAPLSPITERDRAMLRRAVATPTISPEVSSAIVGRSVRDKQKGGRRQVPEGHLVEIIVGRLTPYGKPPSTSAVRNLGYPVSSNPEVVEELWRIAELLRAVYERGPFTKFLG